jgi:AraC family transcriptional regulator
VTDVGPGAVAPDRFVDAPAMLMAGIRREHTFAGAVQGIPEQWRAFRATTPPAQRVGSRCFGVICSAVPAEQRFEYMTAFHVTDFSGLAPDVGRLKIPANHYAVFTHRGHVSTLWDTWDAIWNRWLPMSGYTGLHAPDFEVYDAQFNLETGLGGMEIWYPVEPASPVAPHDVGASGNSPSTDR